MDCLLAVHEGVCRKALGAHVLALRAICHRALLEVEAEADVQTCRRD